MRGVVCFFVLLFVQIQLIFSLSVTSVQLWSTGSSRTEVRVVQNNEVIDLAQGDTIRAIVSTDAACVSFYIDSETNAPSQESTLPYEIAGVNVPWTIALGAHTIGIVPLTACNSPPNIANAWIGNVTVIQTVTTSPITSAHLSVTSSPLTTHSVSTTHSIPTTQSISTTHSIPTTHSISTTQSILTTHSISTSTSSVAATTSQQVGLTTSQGSLSSTSSSIRVTSSRSTSGSGSSTSAYQTSGMSQSTSEVSHATSAAIQVTSGSTTQVMIDNSKLDQSGTHSKSNTPAIIGGVVGGVVALAIIVLVIVFAVLYSRRKKSERRESQRSSHVDLPVIENKNTVHDPHDDTFF